MDAAQVSEFKAKVESLRAAILDKHPSMPTLLREIHTALKKQPENITILDEEDIHTVVMGLERQTGFELAATVTSKKSSGSTKAKLNNLDAF
jgi:hypothetical protein